jgi:hypothetical protein
LPIAAQFSGKGYVDLSIASPEFGSKNFTPNWAMPQVSTKKALRRNVEP